MKITRNDEKTPCFEMVCSAVPDHRHPTSNLRFRAERFSIRDGSVGFNGAKTSARAEDVFRGSLSFGSGHSDTIG